jgi:hypothetical protein
MTIAPVKYHLLKPPFLLKGSTSTGFIYKIQNIYLSKNDIEELNTLNTDLKIQNIKSRKAILKFEGCKSRIFSNNLIMIDSIMPQLLSEVMLLSCFSNLNSMKSIIDELENIDPMSYNAFGIVKIYDYKIHEFLKSLALGLNSNSVWYGEPNIYDHLPVLKDNNELIYYSDSIKKFIEILVLRSEIDKNAVGTIYNDNGENYLILRLQINLKT